MIIKLCTLLTVLINKLLGSTQDISRIHHICRCITELTKILMITDLSNGEESSKSIGGRGTLTCGAALDPYFSYWNSLKNTLTSLAGRFAKGSYVIGGAMGVKEPDAQVIRCLLHSIQVILAALPGLVLQLGPVKFAIAEALVEIAIVSFLMSASFGKHVV